MCTSGNHSNTVVDEPTMVRARHILVDSEEMVDAIRQQIEDGKGSFADLAGLVSTCTSKSRGGDLGWFRRNTMVREFEEAVFSNPPGSVLKVKSEFGWHLIKVEDHGVAAQAITVDEYGRRFGKNGTDDPSSVQLIDCREVGELELAQLPDFLNLPMGEYGTWAEDFESGELGLDKGKETIVMCHHGVRSANFCSFLSQQGFTNVRNLIGGIDAYSRKIDPSIPQY
ncbi:Peptidylprolyl isomerase [Gracilaria domingensis]|nr:Peptidylprolyl isomerase [Gracilaria domingensis]